MDDFVIKELLATRWKAEDFRNKFDQELVKCLEDLITFLSNDTSLVGAQETLLHSPVPSAKRPKISLHSQRCQNSPHNVSNNVLNPKLDCIDSTVLHSIKSVNTEYNAFPVSVPRTPVDQSKAVANAQIPVFLETLKPRKSSPKHVSIMLSQPMDVDIATSQESSQVITEAVLSPSYRSTRTSPQITLILTAPSQLPKNIIPSSSVEGRTVQPFEQPSVTVTQDVIPLRPPSMDKIAASKSAIVEKRLFQSADRIGGVSRLASLGKTLSTLNTSVRKSRLNRSVGASVQKAADRSALVLAAREQQVAEKQRNLLARIKEDEERIKATQETKKAQRDAIKRANEDRRQAAKMRALLADNKLHLYKEKDKSKADQERTKETAVKFGAPTTEHDKENEATTAPSIVKTAEVRIYQSSTNNTTSTTTCNRTVATGTASKTPAGNAPRPLLSHSQTTGGARVPLQRLAPTHTKVAPANLHKPVVANTATKPASSQHLTSATSQKLAAAVAPVVADTSILAETSFDVSKLNSDSDSDDDQPKRKIPAWSRRGNPELINTLNDIYNGKVRWQDEFLLAAQIPFDIADVFHGYEFRNRKRTSSGIWNPVPRQGTYGPYSHGVAI